MIAHVSRWRVGGVNDHGKRRHIATLARILLNFPA